MKLSNVWNPTDPITGSIIELVIITPDRFRDQGTRSFDACGNHYPISEGHNTSAVLKSTTMKFAPLALIAAFVIVGTSANDGTAATDGSSALPGCVGVCSQVPDLVCGSDGVTYLNSCEFENAKCTKGSTLKVAHGGRCRRDEGGRW
ncbi:hypothetical protein ON010_g10663 [Phytophthora cinnamomi]|nr:hypothetical protein ON010_g10663 [Phytophthora cinnamomi]